MKKKISTIFDHFLQLIPIQNMSRYIYSGHYYVHTTS